MQNKVSSKSEQYLNFLNVSIVHEKAQVSKFVSELEVTIYFKFNTLFKVQIFVHEQDTYLFIAFLNKKERNIKK